MRKAVRVTKKGKPKITSRKAWAAYNEGLAADIAAGTIEVVGDDAEAQAAARARASDGCEDCCGEGNVRLCGAHVALCDDGSACVIGN